MNMFDDRLEIFSPGGMPDGRMVQELDLRSVSSRRRNPVIADIFNRLKYMDRRGSGFKKILDSYENQEHYTEKMQPEFISDKTEFWLVLKNLNYGVSLAEEEKASEEKADEEKQAEKNKRNQIGEQKQVVKSDIISDVGEKQANKNRRTKTGEIKQAK